MSEPDLNVVFGRALIDGSLVGVGISIKGDKIVDVNKRSRLKKARAELDATGTIVLPGFVDLHAHVPRDLERETRGALLGGFTTVTIIGEGRELAPVTSQRSFVDAVLVPAAPAEGVASVFARSRADVTRGLELVKEARLALLHLEADTASEEAALIEAVKQASTVPKAIHITPVTTVAGVRAVNTLRRKVANVSCSTPSHNVLFCQGEFGGPIAGELRSLTHKNAVAKAVRGGSVDAIVSAHRPGVETWLGSALALFNLAYEEKLTLERLVEVLSTIPARILGLRAGKIRPGYLANLILVKYPGVFTLTRTSELATAYEGFAVRAHIEGVILRGKVVFYRGEFLSEPSGRVKWLGRSL